MICSVDVFIHYLMGHLAVSTSHTVFTSIKVKRSAWRRIISHAPARARILLHFTLPCCTGSAASSKGFLASLELLIITEALPVDKLKGWISEEVESALPIFLYQITSVTSIRSGFADLRWELTRLRKSHLPRVYLTKVYSSGRLPFFLFWWRADSVVACNR